MKSLPLHACTPSISSAITNRSYSLLHFTALVALFYYRLSSFLLSKPKPSLPYLLVFASEMLLSIIWLFDQAYTWRPVSRTTFPERLPEDEELPGIDVFICTADHKKEPPLEVSSSWFMVFSFIFLASLLKHSEEVLSTGASIQTLLNEQRIWMMKSVTAYTYGSLDAILKCFGMREASFLPTNKVADDEQVALYQMGKLNFQSSTMMLTLIILNMVSLIGGVARMFIAGSWDDTFGQVFLSLYILMVNYPVIEGMLLRKDKGRVPTPVTLLSLVITIFLLCLGHMTLNW